MENFIGRIFRGMEQRVSKFRQISCTLLQFFQKRKLSSIVDFSRLRSATKCTIYFWISFRDCICWMHTHNTHTHSHTDWEFRDRYTHAFKSDTIVTFSNLTLTNLFLLDIKIKRYKNEYAVTLPKIFHQNDCPIVGRSSNSGGLAYQIVAWLKRATIFAELYNLHS